MLRIGQQPIPSCLFLAPLAGYTNLPFRLLIRELGGVGLCTTDLVNARSLIEKNKNAWQLVETVPADHPLSVQLYGTVPEEMRDAALLLQSRGVNIVDINMGCPVRKVCRHGGGSALLGDVGRAVRLVQPMIEALKIPVTCKMRLGWDDANHTAPELARALEDAGVAAIIVHGRTRAQGFGGAVNLAGIANVVKAVRRIPVVGNGDVTTPQAAKLMFDQTGCTAVSIGRGAFYNPWIFRQTERYLKTGELLPGSSFEERLDFMTKHLDRMVAHYGEVHGCRQFRKVALQYSRQFGPNKEFDRRVVKLSSRAEYDEIVADYCRWREQFLDGNGKLRPEYEPRLPVIPVPRGPNELW
jgi:nifR3 family TIM-barrel protein